MQQGWLKIHRKIIDNFLWEDKPFSRGQAWIDLLLMANHEDKKVMFGGKIVEIKRGQKITSIRNLCERWGWSNSKVKYFFQQLKCEKMLDYKSDSKKTLYTIENYNDYQDKEETKNDTETTQKHIKNISETYQKHTNKNDKNDKNIINILSNDKIFVVLLQKWNSLPDVIPKISTLKKDTQRYKMLSQRLNEYGQGKVIEAINNIHNSPWLLGKNNRGWVATFDWFVRPNNFVKVLEGNYLDKKIIDKKGRYIEDSDILTDEEKREREKNKYSGTDELFDKY